MAEYIGGSVGPGAGLNGIAITGSGNAASVGGTGIAGSNSGFNGFLGSTVYQLQITGAGNLGLGALAASNLIYNRSNTGGPLVPPADPSKGALKAKTPPSEATSQ